MHGGRAVRLRPRYPARVFLPLSKILDVLVAPLTWALVLGLAAVLLRRRAGVVLGLAALAVLGAFSLEPVSDALARSAEANARATLREGVTYDAVVFLGGILDPGATRASGELQLNDAAERLTRTYDLLRAGRARHVILSVGTIAPKPGERPESWLLAEQLAAWGIAKDRIIVEDRSRNTRENAVETARIVRARGFSTLLVVTSAAHVPRALGCFRAVGLSPDVLPVDRRAGDGQGTGWFPRARALEASTEVLRELTGRVVYRAVGYAR